MRLHRFILDIDLETKQLKITDKEFLNQVRNVLRLKEGEQIVLTDGKLNEALGKIISIGKSGAEIEVIKLSKNTYEPTKEVVLYCSILKKENFELVVQKATEIGVKEIVPLLTKRTVKLNLKQKRLEKIIKEAAEQSGRGMVPKLHEPIDFEKAVENTKGVNLFFDARGNDLSKITTGQSCNIFIGPEGGWSDEELNLAKDAGFDIVSLGNLTLRAETASTIASYLLSL